MYRIDGKEWHYFAVNKLSPLLKNITSNHKEEFYCLNCFHLYSTVNKLKMHGNICRNCDYCCIEMPKEDNKILEFNHGEKSMKVSFIIYADLESLPKKTST